MPRNGRNIGNVLKAIKAFDGSQQPGPWLRKFTRICNDYGYNTVALQHPVLRQCLEGKAEEWAEVWYLEEANANADANAFKTAFVARFLGADRTRTRNAKKLFDTATKKSDEKFIEVLNRLRCIILDLEQADRPSEAEIVDKCIQGLPLDASEYILKQRPTT